MKLLQITLLVAYFIFIYSISFVKSNDFDQDLGRHIKLGEIIVKTKSVPKTNLFSYTNPEFPFINHHWLSEVAFYGLSKININLLMFLKVALIVSAIAILIRYASSESGLLPTITSALIFSPFFLDRSQIRPEIFGYLFFSILVTLLLSYPKNKKFLFLIPIIMLLWVNIHITFVFGIFLVGLLFLKALVIYKKSILKQWKFLLIIALSFIVLLINPNGIKAVLYPFTIFSNYGYKIAENQNLIYLNQLTSNIWIKYFFVLTPVIFISWILLFSKLRWIELILFIVFYFLALFQSRHMPFFVLAAIPTFAISLKGLGNAQIKIASYLAISGVCIILTLLFITGWYSNTYDMNKYFGVNFVENVKPAVEFLKKNNLPPNIFNNFDIGGYLDFALYPRYKTFVDNRPEAYPADFFQNVYIPVELDRNIKNKVFNQYNVNTVLISHTAQTDWGKSMVIDMYKDTNWKMLYADTTSLIFSKKSDLPDIRNNENYFNQLIDNEENYMNLFQLIGLFNLINRPELSKKAFLKIQRINPDSCMLKKTLMNSYQQNPLLFQKYDGLRKDSWYCF